MGFEGWAYSEQEKKNKKQSEEREKVIFLKNQSEHKKMKEYIKTEIETENSLHSLYELVDKWVLSKEHAEKIIQGEHLNEDTIRQIFDKIDAMEQVKNVDEYLPADLRISKDDYHKAIHDDIFRIQTITKLGTALTMLAKQITPDSSVGLNLFSGFLTILDKNLILLQENTIDVKDNLSEIHEKIFPKTKFNFWQKIKLFFSSIFSDNNN